jgi:hypothetical protein
VGTHTGADSDGGVQTRAIATALEDATGRIPGGVQLQLFLNKPTLASTANGIVSAGEPITGHVDARPASVVAPNSKVRITVQGQNSGQKPDQPLEVPVDAAGNWSFRAPSSGGPFKFSAETVNGFSRSGAVSLSVDVSRLAAPAITAPVSGQPDGQALAPIESIEGTGEAGRTVRLSGDFNGSGLVAADGRWSINVADQPVFGKVSVTAVLTAPGQTDSPSVSGSYTVMPPVPAVQGIRDGKHFRQDALPATIAGTAVDGAEVSVKVDGVAVASVQAGSVQAGSGGGAEQAALEPRIPQNLAGGARWSVPFPAGLAAGAHTLTVTQAVDSVVSLPAAVAFTVDGAPAAGGVPNGTAPHRPTGQQPPAQQPAAQLPPAQLPGTQQPAAQQPAAQQPRTPAQQPAAQLPAARQPRSAQQPGTPTQQPSAQPANPAQAPVPPSPVPTSDPSVIAGGTPSGTAPPLAGTGAGGLLPVAGLGAGVLLLGAAIVAFGRRRAGR